MDDSISSVRYSQSAEIDKTNEDNRSASLLANTIDVIFTIKGHYLYMM